jgi:hypothetical protein
MKTPMALPGGSGYSPRLISLVSSELWAPVELPIPQSASQRGGRDSGMIMWVLTALVYNGGSSSAFTSAVRNATSITNCWQ